ncbi:uncharacterized protein Aud_005838 [Aspergillus udagawae]|uniref:Uncharacterized protein n=1 Tax=Aspergillus udagawae TaxID=91492 RepID=A0A8E0QQW2_9EURO|nr:uncharacterized protein Aud_005838 [Aspergillus udagawae]GIC89424.1 hypothetical protein Aud_005838 [Aspergillus udagawae]
MEMEAWDTHEAIGSGGCVAKTAQMRHHRHHTSSDANESWLQHRQSIPMSKKIAVATILTVPWTPKQRGMNLSRSGRSAGIFEEQVTNWICAAELLPEDEHHCEEKDIPATLLQEFFPGQRSVAASSFLMDI